MTNQVDLKANLFLFSYRVHQRQFDKDSRPDLIVNCVNPGYVDTDMTSHKGVLTVEQGKSYLKNQKKIFIFIDNYAVNLGAAAPSWAALLPPNVKEPKGGYIWTDKTSVDWVNGPTPAAAR